MKYFEELMRSSSCSNGSRHSFTEKGESSRNGEMRNVKSKDKPTYYHCGKLSHTKNICQRKHGMQNSKPNFTGYCFYCKK